MGSDWISHGEESYPEAAWLQLEVFHLENYCKYLLHEKSLCEIPAQKRKVFNCVTDKSYAIGYIYDQVQFDLFCTAIMFSIRLP